MKIRKENIRVDTEISEKQIGFFQNVPVISKQRNEKIILKIE